MIRIRGPMLSYTRLLIDSTPVDFILRSRSCKRCEKKKIRLTHEWGEAIIRDYILLPVYRLSGIKNWLKRSVVVCAYFVSISSSPTYGFLHFSASCVYCSHMLAYKQLSVRIAPIQLADGVAKRRPGSYGESSAANQKHLYLTDLGISLCHSSNVRSRHSLS